MSRSKLSRVFTKDNLIILLISLAVAAASLLFIYNDSLQTDSEKLPPMGIVSEITEGDTYTQRIVATRDGFSRFQIKYATYARTNSGTLTITLRDDDGNIIQTWHTDVRDLESSQQKTYKLDRRIGDSAGKVFYIDISSDSVPGFAVTLYTTTYWGSTGLSKNGEDTGNSICYILGYEDTASTLLRPKIIAVTIAILILIPVLLKIACIFFPLNRAALLVFPAFAMIIGCHRFLRHEATDIFPGWFLALIFFAYCCFWIIASVLLYRWIFIKKISARKLAVILVSFFSLVTIVFLTPGAGNDEQFHFAFAYKYANMITLRDWGKPVDGDGDETIMMRDSDAELLAGMEDVPIYVSESSYKSTIRDFRLFESDNTLREYKVKDITDRTSLSRNNVPLGYIVSGLGIAIGRFLHLGSIPVFYLGRIFNAAFYILLLYLSIRIIPVGKETLLVISLFPMLLQQTATYSYDSFIIGITMLFTAMTVSVFYQDTPVTGKQFIILALLSVALALSKYVYAPLIFILLALPSGKLKGLHIRNPGRIKAGILISIAVCGIIAVIVLQNTRSALRFFIPAFAGPDSTVLSIAAGYAEMFMMTLIKISDFYVHSLVAYPGWYQIYPPVLLVSAYYLLLLFTLLRRDGEKMIWNRGTRILMTALILLSSLLITFPMAAGFTSPESETISSIQGRYFLPLLPLICMCLRSSRIRTDDRLYGKVMFGAGYMGFIFFGFCFLKLFQAI